MGLRLVYFYCDLRETPACLALNIKHALASNPRDKLFCLRKASFTYYWLSAETGGLFGRAAEAADGILGDWVPQFDFKGWGWDTLLQSKYNKVKVLDR